MTSSKTLKHGAPLTLIFCAAFLVNAALSFFTGVPPAYQLSSDALVHVVHWREFSQTYAGNFSRDDMFHNNRVWPAGQLFVDNVLVRFGEALRVDLLTWTLIVSGFSLALFLSGVYALIFFSTQSRVLATVLSLVSIIPVISLGLSGWSFLVKGFVPKELALGIAVWLSLLYVQGVTTGSRKKMSLFFVLLGVCSNGYPVLFFHYAAVILTAEIIRERSLKKEHILYGFLFLASAPVAFFDTFVRVSRFSAPASDIIYSHYTQTLHSWRYLVLHYLRKQYLYALLVWLLWYLYRRRAHKEYPVKVGLWYGIWWSSLIWSLLGVILEFTPYAKYLIARTSVWFYFASMILVGYSAYELYFARYRRSVKTIALFSVTLWCLVLGQTSVLNVYDGIRDLRNDATEYAYYLSLVTRIQSLIPPDSLVLANPDAEANTARAYGGVGTFVAAKDGNVALYDGDAARKWFSRYRQTQAVFAQKNFSALKDFAAARDLRYILFNKKDFGDGADEPQRALLRSGPYSLIRIN